MSHRTSRAAGHVDARALFNPTSINSTKRSNCTDPLGGWRYKVEAGCSEVRTPSTPSERTACPLRNPAACRFVRAQGRKPHSLFRRRAAAICPPRL
jgi:hypothetical protein